MRIWRLPGTHRKQIDVGAKRPGDNPPGSSFGTRGSTDGHRGDVEFAEISASAPLDIRVEVPARDVPDCYYLPIQLSGEFRGGQLGQECRAGPRTLYLLDSSAPHWRELSAGSRMVNVRLPKAMLDRHLVDHATCMRPVAADCGLGAVVWEFATALWQRHGELAAALPAVAETLARLAANLFAPPSEPEGSNGMAAAHRRRLLQCIHDHLGDLQFDVSQAAAACSISTRYVHVLMLGTGRTFARYLLELRLEYCRAALQSSANRSRTITEIAYRWGFSDMSHFSRAFRKCYGMTPREARLRAL